MFDYTTLMRAGLDENQAKYYVQKIKSAKIGSNIGIRMTEETLLQKFEFFKREIGFSPIDVLETPSLLTLDTTDANSPTSAISKIKFLKENLGLTIPDFKNEGYKLLSFSTETLTERIKFLRTYLDFDANTIKQDFSLIIFRPEYIVQKAEYYKQRLGFTNAQFKKYPSLFVFDIDLVNSKLDYLFDTLGLNESALRTFPKLLSLDYTSAEDVPTSVRAKVKFYHDTLGFERAQFQKAPCLLQYDCSGDEQSPTSIRSKIKYYREVLGLENADFQKNPSVLGYDCLENRDSPTSVPAKVAYYKKTLGLDESHIKDNLVLLHLDIVNENTESSVPHKLKVLEEIGITPDDIKGNTKLLLTPAKDIKDKYALWCSIFPNKCFMNLKSWFTTRTEKIYARYKFLSSREFIESPHRRTKGSNGFTIRPAHLDMSESQFKLRFNVSSDELMRRYPLDEQAKQQFYDRYLELGIDPPIQKN